MPKLLDKLKSTDKPFFGHQRALSPDGSFYYLEELVGEKPAVFGFPLVDTLSIPPYNNKYNPDKWVKIAKDAYKSGMIIEFDFHAKHPVYPNKAQDPVTEKEYGGYENDPNNPDKNIQTCLDCPDFYKALDCIAEFFLMLEKEEIEYLFRPWHEMNLKAFWWGQNNPPEDYIKLYQTTVNHLRSKGCNPLFVFAPNYKGANTEEQYNKLYPGDSFVDVIGLDWYYPNPSEGIQNTMFLNEFAASRGKILAFTEHGCKLGGFGKLTDTEKTNYFPSLLEFMGSFDFSYIRFWTADPYLPKQEPELGLFKYQFMPNVRLLNSPKEGTSMELFAVANYRFVKGFVVDASIFEDDETDILALSNPQDAPVYVTFYNPNNLSLTFNGADFGSLQLAPKSFAILSVENFDIKVEHGAATAIPLVPIVGGFNQSAPINYVSEYDPAQDNKKGTIRKGQELKELEEAKLKAILNGEPIPAPEVVAAGSPKWKRNPATGKMEKV